MIVGYDMEKRRRPILKSYLEEYDSDFVIIDNEIRISYSEVKNITLSQKDNVRLVFDTVIFRNLKLQENRLKRSEFIDCVFYNCDITNNYFEASTFIRCEFYDSKLDGSHFVECFLEHLFFSNVLGKFLDISNSKIKLWEIHNSTLEESSWFSNSMKLLQFDTVNLFKADFYETSLQDVDLSSSNIEGMKIDINGIRGSIISEEQTILLCNLIGVKVKEN